MKNRVRAAFGQIEASDALKNDTLCFLRQARQQEAAHRVPRWCKRAALTCAALLLAAGLGGYVAALPVAYVSIDVNPSVELSLNRLDRVVSAHAYNEDGEIVLDGIRVRGQRYTAAIDTIVDSAAMQPYLTADAALTFTVAAADGAREAALLDGIAGCAGCREHGGQSHAVDVAAVAAAHENGLSLGKYSAYLRLAQYEQTLTPADCQRMTMAELRSRIRAHEDGACGEEPHSGGGNGSGHGGGSGNGSAGAHHGGGHGHTDS